MFPTSAQTRWLQVTPPTLFCLLQQPAGRLGGVRRLAEGCLGGYLGGRVWRSSLIQQQQRHPLVVVVSSHMQGG